MSGDKEDEAYKKWYGETYGTDEELLEIRKRWVKKYRDELAEEAAKKSGDKGSSGKAPDSGLPKKIRKILF